MVDFCHEIQCGLSWFILRSGCRGTLVHTVLLPAQLSPSLELPKASPGQSVGAWWAVGGQVVCCVEVGRVLGFLGE